MDSPRVSARLEDLLLKSASIQNTQTLKGLVATKYSTVRYEDEESEHSPIAMSPPEDSNDEAEDSLDEAERTEIERLKEEQKEQIELRLEVEAMQRALSDGSRGAESGPLNE